MTIDILLTVVGVSVVQSIFGVGVLLFGTPILLLLGYSFVDALGVLLPVSMTVNLLQVLRHYRDLDTAFYKRILIYSVPLVIVFLALVTSVKINVTPLIAVLLIFVALKSFSVFLDRLIKSMVAYERIYLMIMGIVHGMSNLGGSMLTVIIHSKHYPKNKTRVTAAASYATVALCQLVTLWLVNSHFTIAYIDKISLMQVGTVVFLLTEEFFYNTIKNDKYTQLFAGFLFVSGVLLILKSL